MQRKTLYTSFNIHLKLLIITWNLFCGVVRFNENGNWCRNSKTDDKLMNTCFHSSNPHTIARIKMGSEMGAFRFFLFRKFTFIHFRIAEIMIQWGCSFFIRIISCCELCTVGRSVRLFLWRVTSRTRNITEFMITRWLAAIFFSIPFSTRAVWASIDLVWLLFAYRVTSNNGRSAIQIFIDSRETGPIQCRFIAHFGLFQSLPYAHSEW